MTIKSDRDYADLAADDAASVPKLKSMEQPPHPYGTQLDQHGERPVNELVGADHLAAREKTPVKKTGAKA
jgi:hypothetical protein